MDIFFQDCLDYLERLHSDIETAIGGLSPEALDWIPADGANSMAVIAVHVAASERYWIGDVIGREPSGRDRDAEFHTRGLNVAALQSRLAQALEHSRVTLSRLTLADLDDPRIHNGQETRVGRALAHALEHVGMHAGHLQITRQLWDQKTAH
jgi:uncharacterized damage-inducible protein DinB